MTVLRTQAVVRHLFMLCFLIASAASAATPVRGYKVIASFPHSTSSYTESFFYLDGLFYEGTGLEGHSAILAIDPATGRVVRQHDLTPQYFGEGIIDWGPYLYEWTWQTQVGFIYDRATFQLVRTFHYTGEGWGMTRTAKEIITSDGSSTLRFRNPTTIAVTRSLDVTDAGQPVSSSTSSNTSRARSTRTSGTAIVSRESHRPTDTLSTRSICLVCSHPCCKAVPKPCSTASRTMRSAIVSL